MREKIAEAAQLKAELSAEGKKQEGDVSEVRASLTKDAGRDAAPVCVIDVEPEIVPDFSAAQQPVKALKEWILGELEGQEITIQDTGRTVTFTRQGIRDSLKRSRSKVHRKAYGKLAEIIENAVYDDFVLSDQKHAGRVKGQEVYYTAMRIQGAGLYAVRIKLDYPQNTDGGLAYKDHKVTAIDVSQIQKETPSMQYAGRASNEVGNLLALDDVHEIKLAILKGSVNPSSLEGGVLSSLSGSARHDKTPVTVVEIPEGAVPQFKKIRDLSTWLRDYFADQKEAVIASTGKRVLFTNTGLAASVKRSREKGHTEAYAGLNELVRRAEYDSFVPKDSRHPSLGGQEIYYSAMRIGKKLYAVRLKFDVPGEEEVAVRSKLHNQRDIEDLRYKDHALREIQIAPIAENYGFEGHTATEAIRSITLGVLRDSVNPSSLEGGVLSSITSGEYLPPRRNIKMRLHADAIRRVADALAKRAKNAAPVRVVQHFTELPDSLQEVYAAKSDMVEGVYDPRSRAVWMVADNLTDTQRVADVWAHEQIVHHGLRGLFAEGERKRVLNQMWAGVGGMANATVREVANRYGLNPRADEQARQTVMEEVLAVFAEKRKLDTLTQQESVWWRRMLAAVARAWGQLVRAVSGRETTIQPAHIDSLLSALGRYVLDGMPEGTGREWGRDASSLASIDDGQAQQDAGRAAWEQLQQDSAEWGQQLDAFRARNDMRSLLTVCRTPDVFRKLGAPDLPMTMTGNNLGKIMSDKPDHNLPMDMLKHLPGALTEPVMVFESATSPDALVVLTELKHAGRSVMVAVHLDTERQRVRVNDIASAYMRGSEAWYIGQIEDGRLLYQDKRKSLAWARTNRLQLPKVRKLPARLSGKKLLTEDDIVKPVAPDDRAPLASLRDIIGMGTRDAATVADNVQLNHFFRKDDLSLFKRIVQLPHWIAKQHPAFARIYERQLQRMDERSAALQKSLEQVPSLFGGGKSNLSDADLKALRELIWSHEGKDIPALNGVEKFMTTDKLANGRSLIGVYHSRPLKSLFKQI